MNKKLLCLWSFLCAILLTAAGQEKAPEDFSIIESQPEGQLLLYERSGQHLRVDELEPGNIIREQQSGTVSIVYAEGSDVYMQFPVSGMNALYNGWVKGRRSADGKRLTFPVGQYVCYTRSFDMAVQVWLMKPGSVDDNEQHVASAYVVDDAATEVVYNVASDGSLTLQGTSEQLVLGFVNRAFSSNFSYLDFEWLGGDYATVLTPMREELPMPPAGMETQQLLAVTGYHDGYGWMPYNGTVMLGFDGDDAWLQGITDLLPEGWVRGHRDGQTLTFASGQLIGFFGDAPLYAIGVKSDDEGNPLVTDSFSFSFDSELQQYTSFDDILISSSATDVQYVSWYMGMTLQAQPDRVATVPEGLALTDYIFTYSDPDEQGRLVSKTYVMKGAEAGGYVYLNGFTPFAPNGWVVGQVSADGTSVTFRSPQYQGMFFDEDSGIDFPIYFQAFNGSTGQLLPQVVFARDPQTHVLSAPTTAISIGISKTGLLSQQYIYNAHLEPQAIETTVTIGHCADELAADVSPMGIETPATSVISAAVRLTRQQLVRYEGMSITRLRFAVRQGFEDVSVWIRTSLDGEPVSVQSVANVADGWNEALLSQPLPIDGSELFIGYTATQPVGFEGILAYGEGNENTSWLAVDNQWADYHEQGLGSLYIQAVAEGLLQQRGATIVSLSTDQLVYAAADELVVKGEVQNLSSTDVQGYTLHFAIDGKEVERQAVNGLLRPDAVASFSRTLSLSALGEGSHEVSVSLDNTQAATAAFFIYESSYPRTLLLEHFTSLPCVNCPRDDAKLEVVCSQRSDVAWVSHHVGYMDDEFTLEAERPLTRFGVDGNPYVMLDRTAFNEGDAPAFPINEYSADNVNTIFDYAVSMPAFVQLHATATVSGEQVGVALSGEAKAFVNALYPRATVHAYLVEDHVLAEAPQAGDADKKYHDNIVRQIITPALGVQPTWQDNADGTATLSAQLSATLDPAWNTDRLRVVAFVAAQAPQGSGYPTGQVLNATQTSLGDTDGVRSIAEPARHAGELFTIDGRRLHAPISKGLYIRDGKKIIK